MKRGVLLLIAAIGFAFGDSPEWVARSNRNSQVLLEILARFNPEAAGNDGVSGIDEQFQSKVTLEVVQLSIECVQPSSDCYTAAGKSLTANRLLLGHIAAVGKKKRDKSVRVTITLFDVDAGEAANVVDRVFKTPELASEGAQDLVAAAAAEMAKMFGPDAGPGATAHGSMARGGKP